MELDPARRRARCRCSSTGSRWSGSAPTGRASRWSSRPTPASTRVWADELKLKQVVFNLLTNAVKFTGAGGSVVVTARARRRGRRGHGPRHGHRDRREDRERIFEAFQRGGRGVRTSTEGTGLGLTLSKRIIDLHGGRLWMESVVGEGSLFGFSLPPPPAPRPPRRRPRRRPRRPADGRRTVVVIDDDPLDLDLVEAVLTPEGYTVARAASGEEGVRLVRQEQPLVVLLDLRMPDMDGFEVAERLRADPETAGVPIIVLTQSEMTRAERDRLAGRVSHLAQKGRLDRAGLVELVGRARRRAHQRAGGRHMTVVLIVEDNPRNLKLVRDLLEHAGHATLEAATAEDGLELARAHAPDLVLMDVQLPGMDGVEALTRLRADPATERITVVALTAFAMADERARFAAAGFDGYLEKPISVREFPGQVAELLDRSARA